MKELEINYGDYAWTGMRVEDLSSLTDCPRLPAYIGSVIWYGIPAELWLSLPEYTHAATLTRVIILPSAITECKRGADASRSPIFAYAIAIWFILFWEWIFRRARLLESLSGLKFIGRPSFTAPPSPLMPTLPETIHYSSEKGWAFLAAATRW